MNLLVHLGMERRLLEEGRPALERFPMASFDETPYSPFMTACRYAVAQPAAEMGITAARLILELIGKTVGQTGKLASDQGGNPTGRKASEQTVSLTARPTSAKVATDGTPTIIRLPTTLIRHFPMAAT